MRGYTQSDREIVAIVAHNLLMSMTKPFRSALLAPDIEK
jgi:hypothetical protein